MDGDQQHFKRAAKCGTGGCVEVALGKEIVVRSSRRPDGTTVHFDQAEWAVFIDGVKRGEFDI